MFIIDNQFPLLFLFFAGGCLGTAFILRKPAGHRAWQLADLVWVVLGLFGALGAVLAGIYKADSSRIARQIDIAYTATSAFDRDAARFRLRYCEGTTDVDLAVLCDRVDFLSASTAENADLPLFIAVTEDVSPLQGLHFFGPGPVGDMDMAGMMDAADKFDPDQLLAFTPLDDATRAAVTALRGPAPDISGDYLVLAQTYDNLITQVRALKSEWEYLQDRAWILLLQILALCLVSFAAPFRLGKSIIELRGTR